MDDELEKKQTFLRTNILEKGYDAEEFMNFLQSKKGEMGLDLNNWNLDELDIAVKEFISSLDKDNILINPQNINKEEENQKNNEEINNYENNDNNLNNNIYQEKEQIENEIKDENDFIECEKIIPNELTLPNETDIKLSFPQKTEGGIFSKSYVTYLIYNSLF